MTRSALPLAALLVLTACGGPMTMFYRPGTPVSRMQSDTLNCEVSALQQAPVANQIRQRPPIYFPGNQFCTAGGCYYSPGYWVDGGIYSVDVNEPLRQRVTQACMAGKGYAPVSIPRCAPEVAAQVPAGQTTRLPELTGASCVVRHDNGNWQIVTPQSRAQTAASSG